MLLLPGFLFIFMYRGAIRSPHEPLVSSQSMTMGWFFAIIAAAVAHAVWIPTVNWVADTVGHPAQVDLHAILFLLGGTFSDKDEYSRSLDAVSNHPYCIASYFLSLWAICGLIGYLAHKMIFRLEFDKKFGPLKFQNKWFYLFTGRDLPFVVTDVWVTVTCQHRETTCLYSGFLESYEQQADGQLERIHLVGAERCDFKNGHDLSAMTPIPGDRFVIWARDINTINLDYMTFEETTKVNVPSQVSPAVRPISS